MHLLITVIVKTIKIYTSSQRSVVLKKVYVFYFYSVYWDYFSLSYLYFSFCLVCRFSVTIYLWFMNPGKDVLLLAMYYHPKEYTIYFLQSKLICYQLSIKDFYLQNCGQAFLPSVVCSGIVETILYFPWKHSAWVPIHWKQ